MTTLSALTLHETARRYGNQTGGPSVAIHVGADEIGRATVQKLAKSGMSVIVCESDNSRLNEAEAALKAVGESGTMIHLCAGSDEGIQDAVLKAHSVFDRIDVLVLGMQSLDEPLADPLQHGAEALRWMEEVSPHIGAAGGGHIVCVVSSIGRYRSSYFSLDAREEGTLAKSAAEGAIVALVRQAAFELAPHKIRVNGVSVGWIRDSASNEEWLRLSERERSYLIEEISLKRLGEPEEVAGAVHFLATPASSYVTGTVLDVNGGWWMS